MSGVARRSWARNEHSMETVRQYNEDYAAESHITEPCLADDALVGSAVDAYFAK
jgi:urocanate hydratase